MEILIPGLILVALMVYASTKIKKNAAAAFDAEDFAGDGFSVKKPDGFVIPAEPAEGLVFEAYTKDSGSGPTEYLRQVSAEIRSFAGFGIEARRDVIAAEVTKILSEDLQTYSMSRALHIDAEAATDGVPVRLFYVLLSDETKLLELKVTALPEELEEYSARIEEMTKSFSLD